MQTQDIIDSILQTKQEIENALAKQGDSQKHDSVFVTFWDFDGTILKGDCSEGLWKGDKTVYPGFVEYGIVHGLSAKYTGHPGFAQFWQEYKDSEKQSREQAYIFIPQVFAGNKADHLTAKAEQHFETMKDYYFRDSIQILRALQKENIRTIVISASADFIVCAGAKSVGIPEHDMHGIEMVQENGILSEEPVLPITYGAGKTHKLQRIIQGLKSSYQNIFTLAGFGNSYHTDGDFLLHIVQGTLPAGQPRSVMINGGPSPKEYKDQFIEIEYSQTVSGL